jgi:hypothetical protein
MPVLWLSALSVLAAIPALDRPELRERSRSAARATTDRRAVDARAVAGSATDASAADASAAGAPAAGVAAGDGA